MAITKIFAKENLIELLSRHLYNTKIKRFDTDRHTRSKIIYIVYIYNLSHHWRMSNVDIYRQPQ